MWNERYSEEGYAYGTAPNDFIRESVDRLTPGSRVVCLASGEGRNAVFLAEQGHHVTAVDLSDVGLRKTEQLAEKRGVRVRTQHADLTSIELGEDAWDGIIAVFAHLPPPARARLHGQIVQALRPGGALLLEAYTPRQARMPGFGGPPPTRPEMFMDVEALKREFQGLTFEHALEVERDIQEGRYHQGLSATVQIVGRKPSL